METPPGTALGVATSPALPAGSPAPSLAEQWEDVLLLEALRYLRISDEQIRRLLPVARSASERLETQGQQEKQLLAALTRIARENRAALLAGRPGGRQRDALFLENLRKRRRVEVEEKIVADALPQVGRILSRMQSVRATLLTQGEPVQEASQPLSPALLSPEAGFVLADPQDVDPRKKLAEAARERIEAVRSRWDEQLRAEARRQLSQRYPPEVVKALFEGQFFDLVTTKDAYFVNLDSK